MGPTWILLAFATLAPAEPCQLQPGAAPPTRPADVAAVTCWGRPGFFVPSREYRRLLEDEDAAGELRLLERENLELRVALSASSSAARSWKEIADHELTARLRVEHVLREKERDETDPAVWLALGGVGGAGAVVAVVLGLAAFFNAVQ